MFKGIIVHFKFDKNEYPVLPIYTLNPQTLNLHFK